MDLKLLLNTVGFVAGEMEMLKLKLCNARAFLLPAGLLLSVACGTANMANESKRASGKANAELVAGETQKAAQEQGELAKQAEAAKQEDCPKLALGKGEEPTPVQTPGQTYAPTPVQGYAGKDYAQPSPCVPPAAYEDGGQGGYPGQNGGKDYPGQGDSYADGPGQNGGQYYPGQNDGYDGYPGQNGKDYPGQYGGGSYGGGFHKHGHLSKHVGFFKHGSWFKHGASFDFSAKIDVSGHFGHGGGCNSGCGGYDGGDAYAPQGK